MDNEEIKRRCDAVNKHLETLSNEEIGKFNADENERNERDFQALKEALERGYCIYCNNLLTHFSDKKPCFHWLLKPKGFKKRHFPLLYVQKSFHRLDAYLRWVATTEAPLKNINDLTEEKSPSKEIETTIRYKNLEWSFSCSRGDYAGHLDKREGKMPHYHFQMKVNGEVIINYGAFHIPFHEEDFFGFAVKSGQIKKMKHRNIQGATIQTFLDHIPSEQLLESMQSTNDPEDATFRMQTILEADEGTAIKGEDIAKIFGEHKRTGVPMAKLLRKLENVKQKTFISPGPGLPELAKRTPHRSR